MPTTVTAQGVIVEADLPPGWRRYDKVVEQLVYPAELATFANFDLPPTGELGDLVPAEPRVELVPNSGILLWLTLGDRDADQNDTEPFSYISPTGESFDAVEPLNPAREAVQSTVNDVREFRRQIGLGSTLYCDLWAWTGLAHSAPPDELQRLVSSLRFLF